MKIDNDNITNLHSGNILTIEESEKLKVWVNSLSIEDYKRLTDILNKNDFDYTWDGSGY